MFRSPPEEGIDSKIIPKPVGWMNGEMRALSTAFYSGDKKETYNTTEDAISTAHHQSETKSCHHGGKEETSAETGERPQHQQH